MRRFLLYFCVCCGIVLLLCLLPGTQRLIGTTEPPPLPAPVRTAPEMPALLISGQDTELRQLAETRHQGCLRLEMLPSQADEAQTEGRTFAGFHDANGNALSRRTYRHSVYQTFILGDMMG